MSRATQIERMISKGQLVRLSFSQDAVAASQTDAQLPRIDLAFSAGSGDSTAAVPSNDEYVMPFEGEIIAIAAETTAAATAGTLTIGPTIDGTEDTALQLSITTATEDWASVTRGTIPFDAGDRIGVEITTGATWDGTTADLVVDLYVLLYLEGI